MKHAKWIGAMVLAVALLLWPETAVDAAQRAAYVWYKSVAPALFPFMALMPFLTCAEAVVAYERLFGWLMRPLFGLPGASAPAVLIGMVAGSPAGAHAAARVAAQSNMRRDAFERLALSVCGLSPAFLISGVGAVMLGSVADGRLLLQTQLAVQLLLLLLTRALVPKSDASVLGENAAAGEPFMRASVGNVLTVCGYMALFSVIAAIVCRVLRNDTAGLALLCFLDLPSGAVEICALNLPRATRLLLLAGMTGWGGLCIVAQCMSVFARCGIGWTRFLLLRALGAALSVGFMWVQLHFEAQPAPAYAGAPEALPAAALIACALALPVLTVYAKNSFLNKRKNAKWSR